VGREKMQGMTVQSQEAPGAVTDVDRRAAFARMLDEDGHDNLDGYLHEAAHLFEGVPIAGRTLLEIGSGKGLMTMYAAMQGAAHVVSMEPEMIGSRSGMITVQQQRLDRLGIHSVEFLPADFNQWDPQGRTFDIVMCRAAINHLHASDQHALHHRPTYQGYLEVIRKMLRVTAPGGVVLITDACRYAFFTATRNLGIRRPWDWSKTGINWRHHQNPQTWARIFREAGFSSVHVRYPLPFRLRQFGGVVDTAAVNFFLQGSFILRSTR
jgi:ubiquinone/menaquinone biosynthesis C-methylase UbiE